MGVERALFGHFLDPTVRSYGRYRHEGRTRSPQTSGLFNIRLAKLHRPRSRDAIDSPSVKANLSAIRSQIETVLRASSRNRWSNRKCE